MMKRRQFLKQSLWAAAGLGLVSWTSRGELLLGHGDYRYKADLNWGALNPQFYPVKDCHELVQDKQGRILLLTNHTRNNILIYNRDGKLLDAWGTEYPGAHGLTLKDEGGEEFLYITDTERHEIIKTTLEGRVIWTWVYPKESGMYDAPAQYLPTETAIADNGDVYVADGYGRQFILHYNQKGELLNVFGGKGEGDAQFLNAHGICIDQRGEEPELLITARQQNQLKRFGMDGTLNGIIDLPGAYICRPVVHGSNVYLATIWSGDGSSGTGFVSILDEHNRLVSAPGGVAPRYEGEELRSMYQVLRVFTHPHDVCVDEDENLYVAQWNAEFTYPIKLIRV
ncbi:MAG: 6-bladed beta-propeller [Phaeodactylibacter sp.]|uniref:6-bladed beta-propeller n=1 Tax=Phaeodactylibacter sp. TaxID=1940289 RepID=UPI0032ECE052